MRYIKSVSAAVCCFSGVFFFACSSGDSGGTTTGNGGCKHFDYSTYVPASSMLTFANDLMPLVATNCAISPACHMNGAHPPDLGPTANAATIVAGLVGVTSAEVASMKYVVKGDPQTSYLMRKIEETNPSCGLVCTPPASSPMGCTTQMPYLSAALAAGDQGKFRDWIKAGANP